MAGRDVLARTWIEQARADLRRDFAIEAVYVFGSFAGQVEHEGSDIDLLVVGEFRTIADEGLRLP